jgi:hypothetical protein
VVHGAFAPLWAALTLLAALLLQAGTNMVNDYYDHRNGVDSSASLSPSGVIQQGMLSPRAVLIGGLSCFVIGSGLGVLLALRGGPRDNLRFKAKVLIWIQYDGTEEGIANRLVELGVPREDIVLAFHPPYKRPYTDFVVG